MNSNILNVLNDIDIDPIFVNGDSIIYKQYLEILKLYIDDIDMEYSEYLKEFITVHKNILCYMKYDYDLRIYKYNQNETPLYIITNPHFDDGLLEGYEIHYNSRFEQGYFANTYDTKNFYVIDLPHFYGIFHKDNFLEVLEKIEINNPK